jgi:hypothetical protein
VTTFFSSSVELFGPRRLTRDASASCLAADGQSIERIDNSLLQIRAIATTVVYARLSARNRALTAFVIQ